MAHSFINSAGKIKEFHDTYPEEAGPPVRLPQWLKAAQIAQNDETCHGPTFALHIPKGQNPTTQNSN
jgi:hypothetical protein